MRVALIVTQLERGGAQAVALDVADGLRGKGHDAEVWFLYRKRDAFTERHGIRCLAERRPASPWQLLLLVFNLARLLVERDIDAVMCFTHYANVVGAVVAWLVGVPTRIATQHNASATYPRLARIADRLLGSTRIYTRNIHCSETVLASFDNYPSSYRDKCAVIYNGVSAPTPARGGRASFGLDDNTPLIVAVGRLATQKNHALLLDVLARVPHARLAIAGDGELGPQLRRAAIDLGIEGRVTFLGELPPDRLGALLHVADLFVMPSLFEGMSIALLEALHAGLPILSSDIPSQREVLVGRGAPCAILLPPADVDAWAAAVANLLVDAAQRLALGDAARNRAELFSKRHMTAAYNDELMSATRAKGRGMQQNATRQDALS
jgi:glycosyltransferase involved in cell wall biosynthesis